MAGLQLLNSAFSQSSLPQTDKLSNIRTANYTQIPSWVSLKSSNLSLKTPDMQHGKLENVHLVSLSRQDKLKEAHEFLLEMDRCNVPVAPQSYKHLLEACSNLRSLDFGKLIHQRLGKDPPAFLVNSVLQMYCDCGSFDDARKVFDEMGQRTLVSWVIIISAYADGGLLEDALELFLRIQDSDLQANPSIYISLLKSFMDSSCLGIGKQIHCQVIKAGYTNNVAMDTSICNMYVKCGNLESASLGFDLMQEKNAVSWTTMMVGCTQADRHEDTLEYFKRMVNEDVGLDEFVFSITLKACAALHDQKNGRASSCQAFERISEPNDVSWSAILTGYSQIGEFGKCIKVFKSLRSQGVVLNEFIYTSIFQVCSAFADFNFGSQAHGDAIKRGLVSYLYGESAMITMYAKCGRLDYAYQVFKSMDGPDTVAWTAMIAGCAYHGKALEALSLFREMQASGVSMNAVTFVAVFAACSHAGLVEEANRYLESMSREHGVEPTLDHYNCMIDIYSRAGLLNEALDLTNSMPFEPDAMSWKSLLGGCSIHRKYELGKTAAEKLLQLDPKDTAAYILLFNLHGLSGRWDEAASIRKLMAERDLRKAIGCSWITVKSKVHRFIVGDLHHPQTEEIYSKLKELKFSDTHKENALLTEDDVTDTLPERKEQLLVHSERLAIAFGLISTPSNAPIVVFKNLRACKDCHDFAKHVSSVTGRTIIVRDSNRFHHFISGVFLWGLLSDSLVLFNPSKSKIGGMIEEELRSHVIK
ncbi:Pentatricopeptide repeat-containing protein, chloroplastic [Sesamum angolense]|uniref:Pentatricopeptide repeat-containing protein, chloroplastic n=1 Tax=Sesamum angolense TaxID=2727404 RepID=A0AAE1WZJ7_9LAMI|nr:Pentatricopeptide repeat-containing protein, chloroplastic [Sesamum angolense]